MAPQNTVYTAYICLYILIYDTSMALDCGRLLAEVGPHEVGLGLTRTKMASWTPTAFSRGSAVAMVEELDQLASNPLARSPKKPCVVVKCRFLAADR